MTRTDEPLRVGVLFSEQGLTAVIERTQRAAILMAIDEVNARGGVLGRPLEAAPRDPRCDPRRFRAEALRLLESGIETIFGCYMSSTRRAVLPVVEQRQGLLFYPTLYEGFEFSESCVYSGAAPNQNSIGLADYLMKHHGDRFYFVGSNYVFPYESNRIMRDYLISRGATVVEERYIPMTFDQAAVDRVVEDIRKHAPVTVFSTTVGAATVAFYRAYAAAGFDRARMPIGSLTTGEPELAAMGAEAAEGHVTSAPYFSVIDSAQNRRFVNAFRLRHGPEAPISAGAEAAYNQVHLFAEAAARAGAADRLSVLKALPEISFDAPQGPVRVDARTHHTWLWPRVARVAAGGAFEIVEAASAPVRPDPYLVDLEPRAWSAQAASF
jgi:branched-chain amino acid transport system substrate-binding protein